MKTNIKAHVIIALAAAVGLLSGCGKKEQKTILVGHFESIADAPETVSLFNRDTKEETVIPVENGSFRHELSSDKTQFYALDYGDEWHEEGFIPDCDTVRFEFRADGNEEYFSPENSLNSGLKDFAAFQEELYVRVQEAPECYSEMMDYANTMLEENSDNYLGFIGFLFASQGLNDDEWLALSEKLSPEMQEKPYIQGRKKDIEVKKETGVGTMFRDFEAEQPDGTVKRLSDYVGKGKYVLVDFWASWCGPCIRETPYIRAAYDKYHGDQFEVLGVAVSDEPENTLKAISEHGIVWDVILNAQHQPGDLYGFSTIPTIFLFGPDGTLLVRDGLRGDAIMDTLAHYLE